MNYCIKFSDIYWLWTNDSISILGIHQASRSLEIPERIIGNSLDERKFSKSVLQKINNNY
jgi:hypothetical protein